MNIRIGNLSGSMRTWLQRTLFPPAFERPGSLQARSSFLARYCVGAGASIFLFAGGFTRRRHRALLNEILAHFGFEPSRPPPELPAVQIDELVSAETPVVLHEPVGRDGNVSLLELLVLVRFVAANNPAAVFEIGTFDGRTSLNLAANTKGQVFTLDLPAAQGLKTALSLDPADQSYISKLQSGDVFAGKPEARRITQLFGDSATFDFSEWADRIDIVFIDGAHSREYVLNDTERALRMLRPTGGVIFWHDYDACFNGVTEALNEIARRGHGVKRIAGTSLAILTTDNPKSGL